MKLRFEVDQAEAFRAGIDCPKSIVTVEVNPADVSPEERNLIADRLSGIDVCELWNSDGGTEKMFESLSIDEKMSNKVAQPIRVVAKAPTYEALIVAIKENQALVDERKARHQHVAIAIAEAGIDTDALLREGTRTIADQSRVPREVKAGIQQQFGKKAVGNAA